MKLLILCCVLLILTLFEFSDGKRGGGGSRGGSSRKSSSGGGSWWSWGSSNNKKSSSKKGTTGTQSAPDSIPKQPELSKPSAPKNPNPEPGFKKEYSNVQQSSNLPNGQQRPIGWDVPASPGASPNGGWKSGYQGVQSGAGKPPAPEPGFKKESANVQHSSNPQNGPQRQNGWDVPSSPGSNPNGGWKSGNPGYQTHQQSQAYPQHGQAYPQHGQAYPHQYGQSYPQQGYGGGMGGYGGGMGGYGGYGGGMGGYGGYGGGMGGYGGGMGGYGGGMGGFGGGMGGYGGYGMQKKSGLFSGSTFRNVLTGMFIWHMTSSLLGGFQSKRPYNVYNYYNQPPVQEEIKLPSNVLTMCEGNVTQLCTGSTAICTTNSTVLCVVTMSGASPCVNENTLCVNATIPCGGSGEPPCREKGAPQKGTDVAVPCLTNLTMDVNLLNETGGVGSGEQYKYCVTTMAVGGPEYKDCGGEDGGSNDWKSVLEGTYTWNLTLPTMKRPYSVYNHQHPPSEAPSVEVVLPEAVLVTCPQNASRLCPPKLTPVCTTFNEIMCLAASISTEYCERFNTTCLEIPEGGGLMPCFTNVTVNAHSPNFDIGSFDGASLDAGANSSFTYHFHYCVTTLGIPGNETDVCVYGKQ